MNSVYSLKLGRNRVVCQCLSKLTVFSEVLVRTPIIGSSAVKSGTKIHMLDPIQTSTVSEANGRRVLLTFRMKGDYVEQH